MIEQAMTGVQRASEGSESARLGTCGEVGEQAQLLVGGRDEALQAPLRGSQGGQVLLSLFLVQFRQLCFHLHALC